MQHASFVRIARAPLARSRRLAGGFSACVAGVPEEPLLLVRQRQRAPHVPLMRAAFVRRVEEMPDAAGSGTRPRGACRRHSPRRGGGAAKAWSLGSPRRLT